MKRTLREPALQAAAAVLALLLLTWPLLVFQRPVDVFVAFFVVWALIIAGLAAIAWAHGGREEDAEAAAESRYDV
ncbi:MAG: hypothetical protein ABW217_12225 [Polyangiaceae bacterium]